MRQVPRVRLPDLWGAAHEMLCNVRNPSWYPSPSLFLTALSVLPVRRSVPVFLGGVVTVWHRFGH